jgi:hypothetical protein
MYYLDVESVPAFKCFDDADDRTKQLFKKKFAREIEEIMVDSDFHACDIIYAQKAALHAEFNKIVCVSLGAITQVAFAKPTTELQKEGIYIKSFSGPEETILTQLSQALSKAYQLCAHFGKGFDFPVLARKYLIHGIPIPPVLDTAGRKPWEVPLYDTQEMWKFTDLKYSVSLDLLAHVFGLPSPKEEMSGDQVASVYYEENDIDKIVRYCESDVRTLINVHRKMMFLNPL